MCISVTEEKISLKGLWIPDKLYDLTNKKDPGDILSIRGQVIVCGFILIVEERETVTITQRSGVKRMIAGL